MSEAALKIHPSIDLEEFERRLRAGKKPSKTDDDPLAELARLVGAGDPFMTKGDPNRAASAALRFPAQPIRSAGARIHQVYPATDSVDGQHWNGEFDQHFARLTQPAIGQAPAADAAYSGGGPIEIPQAGEADAFSLRGSHVPQSTDGYIAAPEVEHDSDESWEQYEEQSPASAGQIDYAAQQAEPRRSARGVMLLVGILAAGAVGFGASLEFKGAGFGAGFSTLSAHSPPVILAGGPTKVVAINIADAGDDNQAVSVLEKPVANKPVKATVVSVVEQPVDLSQQPKTDNTAPVAVAPAQTGAAERQAAMVNPQSITAAVDAGAQPDSSNNGFPQPKRVKVVSVRPDGSIIETTNAETASAAPRMTMDPMAPPADLDANKTTARAGDPAAGGIAADSPNRQKAAEKTADAGPLPASGETDVAQAPAVAPPAPKVASVKTKAARQVADLGNTTATDATSAADEDGDKGGHFSVQLSSSPSEKEARQMMGRMKKKFSNEIGHHKLTFHRVKLDDKTVFRVRVANLTHDAAKDICAKVQSSGGDCFVASKN